MSSAVCSRNSLALVASRDYAVNNQGRLYEPSSFHPGRSEAILAAKPPVPNILVPGRSYYWGTNQRPCAVVRPVQKPMNSWAQKASAADVRPNIDGMPVQMNSCMLACDNTGNNMLAPVPFMPTSSYTLPGGVPFAVRLFKQCGSNPPSG